MIRNKSKGPYDDRKGPVALVVTLSIVLIVTMWYSGMSTTVGPTVVPDPRGVNLHFKTRAGTCEQLFASRLDLLQSAPGGPPAAAAGVPPFDGLVVPPLYRPDFIATHRGMGKLLVGSGTKLSVLNAASPSSGAAHTIMMLKGKWTCQRPRTGLGTKGSASFAPGRS